MGQKRERVEKYLHVVDEFPDFRDYEYAKIGLFSMTTKRERFIDAATAINSEEIVETPSWFFRRYLETSGASFVKKHPPRTVCSYPYKAIPCQLPYAFYIDIKSAYLQIAQSFGAEVFTKPPFICAYGDNKFTDNLFAEHKITRSLIVSATYEKARYNEWRRTTNDLSTITFPNRNFAPHLHAAIFGTLHAIQSIVDNYSVYAHTDGFIVPFYQVEKACKVLDNFELQYTIKEEGFCQIKGIGVYRFGGRTDRFNLARTRAAKFIDNANDRWWLSRFVKGLS
jgi:hypothetical protein